MIFLHTRGATILSPFWHTFSPQALQLATWAVCLGVGMAMVQSGSPLLQALACLPLGMSLVDCCWLAHDYIHGRGRWCQTMRNFGGWGGGALL